MNTPSQEFLFQILSLDEATGKLFWKERPAEMFKTLSAARKWNRRFAGSEAFTAVTKSGYRSGSILYKNYLAHRIIFKMVNGFDPDQVDHERGQRSDNRPSEMRAATNRTNGKNQKLRSTNRSGVCGVHWVEKRRCWVAQIRVDYAVIHLGSFANLSDAAAARAEAERLHGFHPNHGRAA